MLRCSVRAPCCVGADACERAGACDGDTSLSTSWRHLSQYLANLAPPVPPALPPPSLPQVRETEEEQQARLERFAAELEAGGAAGAEPAEQ